jgi:SAM-dependent methyltransferase
MIMPLSRSVVNCSIDRDTFEEFYDGPAPWDIDKPQEQFVAHADLVTSPVLDAGCGTGEHALFFATQGLQVTGIDFVEEAIQRARRKAAERGLSVKFLVKDALTLADWGERFASVIDSGLFHGFSDDDRRRYVNGLTRVVWPGGRLFLMCLSDEEPGEEGPRRVSRQELYEAFADGWEVESVQPARAELNPEFTEVKFSEGGLMVWFAVIRRKGWTMRRGRTVGHAAAVTGPGERPERETMMDSELEHLLRTHCDHEVISGQGSLRDLLTCLRSLAEELQIDFQEALTESDAVYQDRLLQAFDPCL